MTLAGLPFPTPIHVSETPPLPPSARAVLFALSEGGPWRQQDLLSRTGLPPRTLRFAISRLRQAGLVEERPTLADARKSVIGLRRPAVPRFGGL